MIGPMDYCYKPFVARKLSYLIDPRYVISLEDLALMIKDDCIYKIAPGIINKQLQMYFHHKTEEENNENGVMQHKMLCFPIEFHFEHEFEYRCIRHRIYFLKREVIAFREKNSSIMAVDNVLKIPKERIADENNVKAITKNIIHRMGVIVGFKDYTYLLYVIKAFWVIFVTLAFFVKFLCLSPFMLYYSIVSPREYSQKSLENYDGSTLITMTFEGAQKYVDLVLKERNITDLKDDINLRGRLALILQEHGISIMDIGKLLHHNKGLGVETESLVRVVREWIAVGKKNLKKIREGEKANI